MERITGDSKIWGCDTCVVEKGEKAKNSEICCMAGRACCYACMEPCPVKDEYNIEDEPWCD